MMNSIHKFGQKNTHFKSQKSLAAALCFFFFNSQIVSNVFVLFQKIHL